MATYTELTPSDLSQVASTYGLGQIDKTTPFSQGDENSNFRLHTSESSYVLTICESKSLSDVQTLVKTLEHLAKNGFKTTRVIPTLNGESYCHLQGKPSLLKSFLSGSVFDPVPLNSLVAIGESLGRLHKIPRPEFLPGQLQYGIQSFQTLRSEYGKEHPFLSWLTDIESYIQEFLNEDLPKALIHSDVFADNIIHNDALEPVIMDFEEAAVYYRVFDLGMTLVGICRSAAEDTLLIDPEKRAQLLAGYQRILTVDSLEHKSLQAFTVYAATAMASWRFRQFNILFPNLGRQDHYLELQLVAEKAIASWS